ncbi:hypothetical protein BH09MYX1_BH09MYX1_15870 [soil metagenome]
MAGTVTWPIDGSVKFPPRCVLCDTETQRDSEITRKVGRLIVRLRTPVCEACQKERRKKRTVWILSFFGYVGIVVLGMWLLQRTTFADSHGSLMFLATCVFMATCFYWFVTEEILFLRKHTRLWIEKLGPKARALILASHDDAYVIELQKIVADASRHSAARAPASEPDALDSGTFPKAEKAKPARSKPRKPKR